MAYIMIEKFNTEETVNKIKEEIKIKGYKVDELSFIPNYHKRVVDMVRENGQAVVFGLGRHGKSIAEDLKKAGVEVVCFCDNNENRNGDIANGKVVMRPADAYEKYPEACFVVTPKGYENEILQQLTDIGVSVGNIILFDAELAGLAD
jgi:S-adenosylhomocysteine hydrolase